MASRSRIQAREAHGVVSSTHFLALRGDHAQVEVGAGELV